MTTKRPSIKILQEFARQYFPRRCPAVRWKKIGCMGLAVRKKNLIYINPVIPPKDYQCKVGSGWYEPAEKIRVKDGEQYFLTLIHEVGHFKIIKKPPKEWIILKRRLMRDGRQRLKLEEATDRKFGCYKPKTKKEKRRYVYEHVHYMASYEMKQRKGEDNSEFYGRIEDFRDWFMGDMASEHASVEDWARKEFLKHRKKIRSLLVE